jgi:phospholipase C
LLSAGVIGANDDHPPADIRHGQEFVTIYHALVSNPEQWQKTLFVSTIEHGGFADHVAPPAAEDDDPRFEVMACGSGLLVFRGCRKQES